MSIKIDQLVENCGKLSVSVNLYEELKSSEVKSHDDYIVNFTKLDFLQKEILKICDDISSITKQKESVVKKGI